jgi:hypothetical protein
VAGVLPPEPLKSRPVQCVFRLEEGAILSLSPERFIQLSDDVIETRPLKARCRACLMRRMMRSRRKNWPHHRKTGPRI